MIQRSVPWRNQKLTIGTRSQCHRNSAKQLDALLFHCYFLHEMVSSYKYYTHIFCSLYQIQILSTLTKTFCAQHQYFIIFIDQTHLKWTESFFNKYDFVKDLKIFSNFLLCFVEISLIFTVVNRNVPKKHIKNQFCSNSMYKQKSGSLDYFAIFDFNFYVMH